MKTLFSLFLSLSLLNGLAQIDCINFGDYTDAYLSTVSSDHATYPPGSTFISSGDLQLIKPNTSTFYQFISGVNNEMCYIGELGIDVSSASYNCRKLTFDLVAGFWISIDGDTVNATFNDTTINSSGWTFESDTTGGDLSITIEGDFDYVEISPSTTCISNICLSNCSSSGPSCVNFGDYTDSFLTDVSNDHSTYPAGSAFITEGDIQLIKPNTFTPYQFINPGQNQMCYVGWLGIDVSTASYTCRELSFDLIAGFMIEVDGDSVPALYADTTVIFPLWNYHSDTTGGDLTVTISGQFDYVEISQSTTCISNICLSDCSSSSSCLNLGQYSTAYVTNVTADNITYPAGATFASSGDIQLVKPSTVNSFYQFVDSSDNSLVYIGELGIDVSTAIYPCRVLSFNDLNILYTIDGDTIWNPFTDTVIYRPNWSFTVSNSGVDPLITIEGNFDYVQIGMTTSIISNICLAECTSASSSCLDFANYSNAYIQDVGTDHATYPNGSTFMSSGDIDLIKVDSTNFFPMNIDSLNNEFCFIGNLGIDVSGSAFNCKKLTYTILAGFYTAIDGDTIYGSYYDTTIYNPNWTYNSDTLAGDQYITIEGDFDYVEIGNSTMCISNICLDDCSTGNIEDKLISDEIIDYLLYPNPTGGSFTIQTSANVEQLLIHNMQGQLIMASSYFESNHDISDFENGFYLVSIVTTEGEVLTQKVLKQH